MKATTLSRLRLTASRQHNWIKSALTRAEQVLKQRGHIPVTDPCVFVGLLGSSKHADSLRDGSLFVTGTRVPLVGNPEVIHPEVIHMDV